jgi:GAF domain-containing protein
VFHAEAVRGYDIGELSDLHLKLGEGIVGNVALTGQSRISPNVREDPLYINAREKTRSEMVAPIISNDEVIGCFDLESDELNAYSHHDLEVLTLLASQVAIIIEKVELHEQLVEKKRLQGQLEVARQVTLIGETGGMHDVRQRKAEPDESARLLDAHLFQILVRRQAERRAKDADEMERAQPRLARELADRHGRAIDDRGRARQGRAGGHEAQSPGARRNGSFPRRRQRMGARCGPGIQSKAQSLKGG